MQRNHTLFGSVWSSLKRKKLSLSVKHGLSAGKAKKIIQIDGYDDGRHFVGGRGEDVEARTGGVVGGHVGFVGIDHLGDPVNSAGELQTRVQQNIPMRPLVINSNNNHQNYGSNVSPNVPNTE